MSASHKEVFETDAGQVIIINIWPEFLSYEMAAAMTGYGADWWKRQVAAGNIPATRPPIINSLGKKGKGDPKLEKQDILDFLRRHKVDKREKKLRTAHNISKHLR